MSQDYPLTAHKTIWDFLQAIFAPDQYMLGGNCYLWQRPLVGLHVIRASDQSRNAIAA
ncbi:hypothetical protein PN462_09645 [Spirulina sp. CS-785/01]|uniref:hypothetical protein n=1 Tax=Spirulina sp. CS-785/01 TaxID=3021716 RepID=UPI00232AA958|nr:hypothetical protein [Spirulina sp. CS-785/01]MDB9313361.1 hypothetical protein [Spirulina sp. CS-785/01]